MLEEFHAAGSVRTLGVSNVDFPTLERLWNESTVKPGVVQNRFYNRSGYDRDLRAFCQHNSVAYQGFWTLTGNRNIVSGSVVSEIASRLGKPPVSVYYRALMQLGLVVLDGTKSTDHMREDLEVLEFELDPADVAAVALAAREPEELEAAVGSEPFAKFLVLQTALLAFTGGATGVPFTANALITAVIYACSRLEPFGNIQFQFGITLKYWMLPFGLMAVEMLQQQGSVAAVVPHILGVLCAHFHHFFAVVWPRIMLEENGGDAPGPRSKASPLAQTRAGRKLGSG